MAESDMFALLGRGLHLRGKKYKEQMAVFDGKHEVRMTALLPHLRMTSTHIPHIYQPGKDEVEIKPSTELDFFGNAKKTKGKHHNDNIDNTPPKHTTAHKSFSTLPTPHSFHRAALFHPCHITDTTHHRISIPDDLEEGVDTAAKGKKVKRKRPEQKSGTEEWGDDSDEDGIVEELNNDALAGEDINEYGEGLSQEEINGLRKKMKIKVDGSDVPEPLRRFEEPQTPITLTLNP